MALFDKILGEFIDIIEWTDPADDVLAWKFPRYQDEIKNGAKLTVRPGQMALFVNEGKIADIFEPGMHTLSTSNLPILSTLRGWKFGFNSPFKADVVFISTRQYPDIKWGTKNPITLRDADFGIARIRAFGSCILQVENPQQLVEQVSGTTLIYTVEQARDAVRNLIVSRFSDMLGTAKIPLLDLAAKYDEMGTDLNAACAPELAKLGLKLPQLLVENISLPEEVEKAIDKRASMGAIGNLDNYAKFQAANAMEAAAQNPGAAGASMGMGMGMMFAGQMGNPMVAAPQASAPQPPPLAPMAPPPLPTAVKEWWIGLNGQQNGPHEISAVIAMFGQGQIQRESLVWKQGMAGWVALASVPELARHLPPA